LNYLKTLKENFGITISTDYLRELLIFKGFNQRKASFSIYNFIKRNKLTENLSIGSKDVLLRYYKPYGCNAFNDVEVIGENSYSETLGFISAFKYKKEMNFFTELDYRDDIYDINIGIKEVGQREEI